MSLLEINIGGGAPRSTSSHTIKFDTHSGAINNTLHLPSTIKEAEKKKLVDAKNGCRKAITDSRSFVNKMSEQLSKAVRKLELVR
jgi:hypothetical protein